MSINQVSISGNLTRDAELRSTAKGMFVLGVGVAVNDRRQNAQTGQWEDYPNFIDCSMFGSRAQKLASYLTKGTKVAIEGKLRWSQWESNGQKRSKVEVIIDEIEFLSSATNGHQAQSAPAYAPQQYQPQQAPTQPQMAPQMAAHAPMRQQQYAPQKYAPQQYQAQQAQAAASQVASGVASGVAYPVASGVASQVASASPSTQPVQQQLYDEDIPF